MKLKMLNILNEDLKSSAKLWKTIIFLSWSDLISRYRRSILGPFWIVIGVALGSAGIGFLWSQIWNMPREEIIPSITIGFCIWIFISSSIIESPSSLTASEGAIKNVSLPLSFFPMIAMIRQFINFIHSWIIILIVSIIYPPDLSFQIFWFFPGLLLTIFNLFLLNFSLSIIGARYRDTQPLVSSVIPILFFLSPVLFRLQQVEEIAWIIWFNPLTYFVSILREPLQGASIDSKIFTVMIVFGIINYLFLGCLLYYKKNKIIHWI
jgi:ABC-type polysaccharide/polyol phosphate export permease